VLSAARFLHRLGDIEKLLTAVGVIDSSGEQDPRRYEIPCTEPWLKARWIRSLDVAVCREDTDAGIAGLDVILECGADCEFVLDLGYGEAKVALLVHDTWDGIGNAGDLVREEGARGVTVYTRFPDQARQFFMNLSAYRSLTPHPPSIQISPWHEEWAESPVTVRHISGKAESLEISIDGVSSGTTARANHRKPIATILERSTAWLTASHAAMLDPLKKHKIRQITDRLKLATKDTRQGLRDDHVREQRHS
jgi:ATP phosphoribosyltransferase